MHGVEQAQTCRSRLARSEEDDEVPTGAARRRTFDEHRTPARPAQSGRRGESAHTHPDHKDPPAFGAHG
ncbi:hypothetical protein GCM10027598_58370 [Amycolatopsis oliviviridis]